jgi:23S rRNA (pseudouridine1915-N3)-methyltransferase
MQKITILTVGKTKISYLTDACVEFEKRLSPHKIIYHSIKQSTKEKESQQIVEWCDGSTFDYIVALDELGTVIDSMQMAGLLKKHHDASILFIIGGPDGFDQAVKQKSHLTISLSRLTFTHDFAYLILLEQIYRGYTILEGRTYHRQ